MGPGFDKLKGDEGRVENRFRQKKAEGSGPDIARSPPKLAAFGEMYEAIRRDGEWLLD